ncbi:hypothetical protein [Methylocystis parvus]|uniref:hypothetical protein n=1 Tax=Methylocystis parvus TaxID=134 RepID=UPI003C79223B
MILNDALRRLLLDDDVFRVLFVSDGDDAHCLALGTVNSIARKVALATIDAHIEPAEADGAEL